MTTSRGGRIAPDGRPPTAPGVGPTSNRHDLERPATPGLSPGSDLQYGDVSALEQGQRIAPATTQGSASVATRRRRNNTPNRRTTPPGATADSSVPNPIDMATGRLANTLTPPSASVGIDPTPWLPLLRRLMTDPSASGALSAAFVAQMSQVARAPYVPQGVVVDLQELDAGLEQSLGS